ncbi:MAG: hypothetical protein Q4E51_03690 [Lachnospiraceae bacterium]|nr:hypothetical protein [Lachnospiraceae bacterium]
MADVKHEKFENALKAAKVPVLVLDNKWHRLFKKIGITDDIKRLEKELNELLKRQGKINNEMKALKKIKSDLMGEIVNNMDDGDDSRDSKASNKKLDDNKRLINEANDKMASYEDEMLELPREIDRVNKELMLHTMDLCYDKLSENTDQIEEIANWIRDIRIQLKKNVIRKQEMEMNNADLYTFMHNIFGNDVMDLFDMRYEPKLRVPENKKEEMVE